MMSGEIMSSKKSFNSSNIFKLNLFQKISLTVKEVEEILVYIRYSFRSGKVLQYLFFVVLIL